MSEKILITGEMVEYFKDMLLSYDQNDTTFALNIFENRDKANTESEANMELIHKEIIQNETLFPKQVVQVWVAAIGDRVLRVNGRAVFETKGDCMGHTSRHLTKMIGTSGHNMSYYNSSNKYFKVIKHIFKGGKELRDYLYKNNIIQIKQLL